jgi:hypothetical protein
LCIKFPLALAEIPSPLTRKNLCTGENQIYCDNKHKKKALRRPDADTSGTQKKQNNIVF